VPIADPYNDYSYGDAVEINAEASSPRYGPTRSHRLMVKPPHFHCGDPSSILGGTIGSEAARVRRLGCGVYDHRPGQRRNASRMAVDERNVKQDGLNGSKAHGPGSAHYPGAP
jgi:hypothetical protein